MFFFILHLGKGGKMGLIYLIKPKKYQLKYIYNKSDLKKRIQKNKLRPGNERVIPKANFENIKFGRCKGSKNSLYNRYKPIVDEIELRNELSKISLLSGMVSNDKMSINQLNSFFEQKRKSFEPLVTNYIKKINEHSDSLTKH